MMAAALSFAVGLALLASGCLFPPVVPAGADTLVRQDGGPVPGAPLFDQQVFQRSERGAVSAGATVMNGVEPGTQPHIFDLPARVIAIRLELDWDSQAYDLDLSADLRRSDSNGTVVVWEAENREGSAGEPDDPAELFVSDRGLIHHQEDIRLRVVISAKAGVDVPYTLSVRAVHLVPAG